MADALIHRVDFAVTAWRGIGACTVSIVKPRATNALNHAQIMAHAKRDEMGNHTVYVLLDSLENVVRFGHIIGRTSLLS
jgi:hypothetical protein